MGSYLLDTHTAIWYFNGDKALSETARKIILDLSNQIHLSIISEQMTFISADRNVAQYDVPLVW